MVPAGRFANDKHHVGIIQTFRRDVGELLRRVNQRFVV